MLSQFTISLALACLLALSPIIASGNLLRNGAFQDDWITRLTEVKNHHYCFSSEHYNRRDFNPDGWECRGSWDWHNADGPMGTRRMVLRGPNAEVSQRVNWVLVHDEKQLAGMADAGRFPGITPLRSKIPQALVRDLALRVQVKGMKVAADAGSIEIGLCPPGTTTFLPFGSLTPPTVTASAAIPAGTYDRQWVEVKLPARQWLEAAEKIDNDPNGPVLPGTVSVTLKYTGAGEVEIGRVELSESGPASPNLLPNGGFDGLDAGGYPAGWGKQEKYTYFPPGNYYLFNTWHNSTFPNRGPVEPDALVLRGGSHSLKMIVPAGDEKSVASPPIVLNQQEPRLIEVQAWVKTDHLCMLQLDAVDENAKRLEGMLFIHKAAVSIGTDDWRLVRQVFRPRQPVKSIRLLLCARGVNGYTLDDTSEQPQNTATGTIWWDDIKVSEPESTARELAARRVKTIAEGLAIGSLVENFSLGEQLLGENVLHARVFAPMTAEISLRFELTSPTGKKTVFSSPAQKVKAGQRVDIALPYQLTEPCPAYAEYHAALSVVWDGKVSVPTEYWLTTWTAPIDLQLGNLYLLPNGPQLVRLNFGLANATMKKAATARLQIIRKGSGQVLKTVNIPATPDAFAAQRNKIPAGLRGDFTNLLLVDLDVADLPVQPFNDPQRNWFVRATLLDAAGNALAAVDSPPFCRLAHEPPQPPVQNVRIDTDNNLYVNGQPWMPWGVVYGHQPVYDGPADPGAGNYFDMRNLPDWGIYDRFTGGSYTRSRNDFNTLRYVASSITPQDGMEKSWKEQNLYASTAFVVPHPVWSHEELVKNNATIDEYLAYAKTAPMIVSTTPGIEEAFALFHSATPEQIKGMEAVVRYLREKTGKPVMVGHGGFWNRFEFEKALFFDIFDPETEPFYPANLHTDLQPIIEGQAKTVWLRPQMYESVPYERWRYHVLVELMRGCRGWQIAHGPGDQSLFRGLHGELEFLKPIVYAKDKGPRIAIEPSIEHFSRRHNGKTYLIAATTHGMTVGTWRWSDERDPQAGRTRIADAESEFRTAANNYGTDAMVDSGPRSLGIENLPDARVWPAGSKLVQWVKLDPKDAPNGLLVLAKADGRWTAAGQLGAFDLASLRANEEKAHWFLSMFYRNAQGFAFSGWYGKPLPSAMAYIPGTAAALGNLPAAGQWVKLEIPLDALGATGKLLDGTAFLYEAGAASWGRTAIVAPDGAETEIWGDQIGPAPEALAKTKITVQGLKAGAQVKVLFEDREITAGDGFFIDDFRGQDLYQRFGGGLNGGGYGDTPVALHVYEIP
jgi:hypothetical protein